MVILTTDIDDDGFGGAVDGKDNRNKITETGYTLHYCVQWIKYPWNTNLKQMCSCSSLLFPQYGGICIIDWRMFQLIKLLLVTSILSVCCRNTNIITANRQNVATMIRDDFDILRKYNDMLETYSNNPDNMDNISRRRSRSKILLPRSGSSDPCTRTTGFWHRHVDIMIVISLLVFCFVVYQL